MASYVPRLAEKEITKLVRANPAVVIVGPRQVGKTSIAKHIAAQLPKEAVYFDLENPDDYHQLTNPTLVLDQLRDKTVILDEVQRVPTLFPMLRSLIDRPVSSYSALRRRNSSAICPSLWPGGQPTSRCNRLSSPKCRNRWITKSTGCEAGSPNRCGHRTMPEVWTGGKISFAVIWSATCRCSAFAPTPC